MVYYKVGWLVKVKKKTKKLLTKIVYWAFFLFLVYIIIELIRKILGGSLPFEEIVIGLLVANLGYSFHLNSKISGHIGWHKGKDTKK